MRFILLYNCPLRTCDKLWLYNGLKKNGEVKVVGTLTRRPYARISRFAPKLKIGKIVVLVLTFIQCFRAVFISKRDDIVVTWSSKQGCFFNSICRTLHLKRKAVSFMWIALPSDHLKMIKKSFEDENFLPIINNESLADGFVKLFNLKKWNGIYLPDVFDDEEKFYNTKYKKNGKYVFSGGINNRDWDTLIHVARNTPDINYIIVCDRKDMATSKLENVIVKENIPLDDYYSLMSNAFMTICPLKEDRTSGLINIIKSSQFGVPCISTKLKVTEMYYSNYNKNKLQFDIHDSEDLRKKIIELFDSNEVQYKKIADDFQNYIRNNFCPKRSVEKLISELKKRDWI